MFCRVITQEGKEVELLSSIECKGIKGNDGRYYVLDLLRTFPPDTNFLPGTFCRGAFAMYMYG